MKKVTAPPRLEQPGTREQTFREKERTLLALNAKWPRLEETSSGIRRVNRYYDALARRWWKRWEGPFLAYAKEEPLSGSRPRSASLTYEVTLFTPQVLSLRWEVVEDPGEGRPRRVRQGDIWALPQGTPILPGEVFAPLGRLWRKTVLEEVGRQINARLQTGESLFREDWPQGIARYLSPEGFYLTGEGPRLFYPVEAIAPAFEGFPDFSLASLLPQGQDQDPGHDPAEEN